MDRTAPYYLDKAAVVTGGASGIGLALAEAMLGFGARRVVIADIDEARLAQAAARLEATHPGRVLGLRCDVTQEPEVQALIRRADDFGGGIDLLFNNAGAGLGGIFDRQTDDDWAKGFALNFHGALYGIRAVLPVMRRQGSGHIVSIISGIALTPMAYQTMYAATKAALNGLTLALRYELWDENIRVTSATPGTTATPLWARGGTQAPPGAQSPEQSAQTILAGVALNQRLVLGDAGDAMGARDCFDPARAEAMDDYLLNVARQRRSGHWIV